jgi:hypothetical protein
MTRASHLQTGVTPAGWPPRPDVEFGAWPDRITTTAADPRDEYLRLAR